MALVISKTYEANTILTEADLDNIRSSLLTLSNTTKLDETFLKIDSIIGELSTTQVTALLTGAQEAQTDSFIGIADSDAVQILKDNRPKLVEQGSSTINVVVDEPGGVKAFFTQGIGQRGTYLISVFARMSFDWFTTRASNLPSPGDEISLNLEGSIGVSDTFSNDRNIAPFSYNTPLRRVEPARAEVSIGAISGTPFRAANSDKFTFSHTFLSNLDYVGLTSEKKIFAEVNSLTSVSSTSGTVFESEVTLRMSYDYFIWRVV